jgi:hypothetical protein
MVERPIKLCLVSDNFNSIKKIFFPLNHSNEELIKKAENFLVNSSLEFRENNAKKSVSGKDLFFFETWHGYRIGRYLFLCLTKKNFETKIAFEFLSKFSNLIMQYYDELDNEELLLSVSELFDYFEKFFFIKKNSLLKNKTKTDRVNMSVDNYFHTKKNIKKKKTFWIFLKENLFILLICAFITVLVILVPLYVHK